MRLFVPLAYLISLTHGNGLIRINFSFYFRDHPDDGHIGVSRNM
jgi:hypothetical protein